MLAPHGRSHVGRPGPCESKIKRHRLFCLFAHMSTSVQAHMPWMNGTHDDMIYAGRGGEVMSRAAEVRLQHTHAAEVSGSVNPVLSDTDSRGERSL